MRPYLGGMDSLRPGPNSTRTKITGGFDQKPPVAFICMKTESIRLHKIRFGARADICEWRMKSSGDRYFSFNFYLHSRIFR